MLKIEEIKNKDTWESFLLRKEIEFYPFFQSWNWGEVQKKLGFNVSRIGILNKRSGELMGICQITDIKAKRGHYLHIRHGPVLADFSAKKFDFILDYLKEMASKMGASFIRISPFIKESSIQMKFFKERGFLDAPIHRMDAEVCWFLDISRPEDQLLKEMRKTHRYLIRKAQTLNIKILRSKKLLDIDKFIPLYVNLSQRKGFIPHKGVKEEYEYFAKDDKELLLLAEYKNKIISGALISFVNNMAIYRHGASNEAFRDIPASYLLQWEAIKEARRRGKKLYNFWGIAPLDAKRHPWKGISLFKTGFGGKQEEFVHAQDLPLNISYWQTYAIEYFTKIIKGY